MKYYVIEICEGDSKVAGKSIYEYATLKEAEASFHSKIGTAMKSELYTSQAIFVLDNACGVHFYHAYSAVAEEAAAE